MTKNIIAMGAAGLAAIIFVGLGVYKFTPVGNNTSRACTQEARLCPDGSAVGRTGPNCEFDACPSTAATSSVSMTEAEARVIAEKACIKGGEALSAGSYNPNSKTWWFDANLNATRAGCNPACVVSEETKTAEINWRCTGAIIPPVKITTGYVAGHVTIGPNCPVERIDQPCLTPPEAYTSRSVVVYAADGATVKQKVALDTQGKYKIALAPGTYWLQIQPAGIGPGKKVQAVVTVGKTTTVDFSVDTGIR